MAVRLWIFKDFINYFAVGFFLVAGLGDDL